MRSLNLSSTKVIRKFKHFFDVDHLNALARQFGFLKRKRLLCGFSFVRLCICMKDGFNVSLVEMCSFLRSFGVRMSPQSLDERFNECAVQYMEYLFHRCQRLSIQEERYKFLNQFNGIYLQDATGYQLPNCYEELYPGHGGSATQSALKLDLIYNYQNASFLNIKVCGGTSPDYAQSYLTYPAGSLVLRDLGYLKMADLKTLDASDVFYISRLRNDITIYGTNSNKRMDPLKLSHKMRVGQVISMQVHIGVQRFPCRLVIKKLSKKEADAIRYKIKTDKNNKRKGLTAKRLERCRIKMYITNLSEEQISNEQMINLYRLRWQIELIFKSWKGTYRLENVKPMKWERFKCMLYGCLIRAIMNFKLMAWAKTKIYQRHGDEISEMKSIKNIDLYTQQWNEMMACKSWNAYRRTLFEILSMLYKTCRKQPKRNKPTPLNRFLT